MLYLNGNIIVCRRQKHFLLYLAIPVCGRSAGRAVRCCDVLAHDMDIHDFDAAKREYHEF